MSSEASVYYFFAGVFGLQLRICVHRLNRICFYTTIRLEINLLFSTLERTQTEDGEPTKESSRYVVNTYFVHSMLKFLKHNCKTLHDKTSQLMPDNLIKRTELFENVLEEAETRFRIVTTVGLEEKLPSSGEWGDLICRYPGLFLSIPFTEYISTIMTASEDQMCLPSSTNINSNSCIFKNSVFEL